MLYFKVAGSEGDIYEIAGERHGARLRITCTCEAGQNGMHCRHRIALLDGDVTALRSGNKGDVEKLTEMLPGSDLETALAELAVAEAAVVAATTHVKGARAKVGRVMSGT